MYIVCGRIDHWEIEKIISDNIEFAHIKNNFNSVPAKGWGVLLPNLTLLTQKI